MKKLTENTINITKKVLNERSSKKPEQLDELLGGLKRMFGKPGSPEDQEVLDYIQELPRGAANGFPELANMIKTLSAPNQIKRGFKDPSYFAKQGEAAGLGDKRKVSPKNVDKLLQRAVEQLERLQTAAQGKTFKGTAGLMMRLIQSYMGVVKGGERERQRDAMDSASRTVSRQAAADRGSDRSLMNKRIRNL